MTNLSTFELWQQLYRINKQLESDNRMNPLSSALISKLLEEKEIIVNKLARRGKDEDLGR